MSDMAMNPEKFAYKQPSSEKGGGWKFLKSIVPAFFGKSSSVEQRPEIIQIPPESGYARWIRWLEEKNNPINLTANELTRLYPHLVMALKKPELKVDPGGREELLELLNSGNVQTVIRLAEFVRDNSLKGQNIAAVKRKSNRDLSQLELEAILADQLVNRLNRQIDKLEQNPVFEAIPSTFVQSTEGLNLDPDYK